MIEANHFTLTLAGMFLVVAGYVTLYGIDNALRNVHGPLPRHQHRVLAMVFMALTAILSGFVLVIIHATPLVRGM